MRSSLPLALVSLLALNFSRASFGQDLDRKPPQQIAHMHLLYPKAEWVAQKLTAQFGGDAAVVIDKPNNSVFIRADADTIRRIKRASPSWRNAVAQKTR